MHGNKIRQFRLEKGYSQKELAKLLNVTSRTISRWEQNNNQPNPDELHKLAKLIGVSAEDLERDNDVSVNDYESKQTVLERIFDSVDNLVTGQESINESIVAEREEFRERQGELIQELRAQNSELMKKLEETKTTEELQREILRQKRIRNLILLLFGVIFLLIISIFIWFTINFGPNPNIVTTDQPEVFTTN
jgi:transcriptional regulator with XRE-family HTH domain